MSDYRLYFLDNAGHFTGVREIRAETDAEALEIARADPDRPRRSELWMLDRRVAVLESDRQTASH